MEERVRTFREALELVGLDCAGLMVEGFRTDGTSNYLANLNYHGQTWAAALRMPAQGAHIAEFLEEKRRALEAVSYLLMKLPDGVDVGFDCMLKFGGVSTLVENASSQAFLRDQHRHEPLLLLDLIGGREKKIEGLRYPDSLSADTRDYVGSYDGAFYLSRGAPAWETLEEYPELEEPAAHALACLHRRTGTGDPVPLRDALIALDRLQGNLILQADEWSPLEGSKEAVALAKSMQKWSGTGNAQRAELIKRERYLRTSTGRAAYRTLFETHVGAFVSRDRLRSFCHGDSHGGNFIVVRYQYGFKGQEVLVDRVFLNEIFERHNDLNEVAVSFDEALSKVSFERRVVGSLADGAVVVERRLHHEIHPIDLDSGTGTTDATKVIHLYDALLFAISLQHITTLFAEAVQAKEVLVQYYDGLADKG